MTAEQERLKHVLDKFELEYADMKAGSYLIIVIPHGYFQPFR